MLFVIVPKRGVSTLNCTAYITHYPCIICTRLLLASGITSIKYIDDYKNDELVHHFCKKKCTNYSIIITLICLDFIIFNNLFTL